MKGDGPPETGSADDSYIEPAKTAEFELREKGSRFLAEVRCVRSAEEAAAELTRIRKKAHDATHHCSAWRLNPDGSDARFDDDGEPSGTAGPPILRQIDGRGLRNVIVVVTRWYGGTKLGTGGLIRAYGDAAAGALDRAGRRKQIVRTGIRVRFSYEDTSPAMHTINRFDAVIVATEYGVDTIIDVAVRASHVGDFEAAWTDATRGRGQFEVTGPA